MIRVLIADDQALVRGGFRMILEAQKDIEVVGEAEDGARGARAGARAPARRRADGHPHARARRARGDAPAPRAADGAPRVLMLTTFDLDEYVYEAMKAGASGFLLKDVRPEQLAEAVRVVAAGDALLAPAITRRLIEEFVRRPPPGSGAAGRARRAHRARARGAEAHRARALERRDRRPLFLSEATVKTHVTHILAKLGLRDRVQAVVLAYESGLVQPGAT